MMPYVVDVEGTKVRLVPFGGGRGVAFSAPRGRNVQVLAMSGGRIVFKYDPPVVRPSEAPYASVYAVRERDGRIRTISKSGGHTSLFMRPGGTFLLVQPRNPGRSPSFATRSSPDGTLSLPTGPNGSPLVRPSDEGWFASSPGTAPSAVFGTVRARWVPRAPRPEAISPDRRIGAFVRGDTLSIERVSFSERGFARGRVLARAPLGGELEKVEFHGEIVAMRWRSSAYGSWHLILDLARGRAAWARTDRALHLSWMRRGGAYVGLGNPVDALGPSVEVVLPSRRMGFLPLNLPSNPRLARPRPLNRGDDGDGLIFALP